MRESLKRRRGSHRQRHVHAHTHTLSRIHLTIETSSPHDLLPSTRVSPCEPSRDLCVRGKRREATRLLSKSHTHPTHTHIRYVTETRTQRMATSSSLTSRSALRVKARAMTAASARLRRHLTTRERGSRRGETRGEGGVRRHNHKTEETEGVNS